MSTAVAASASLCSSTQINGFGEALRPQKNRLSQSNSIATFTRSLFFLIFALKFYWVCFGSMS